MIGGAWEKHVPPPGAQRDLAKYSVYVHGGALIGIHFGFPGMLSLI
jgi:hypothetical protein